MATKTTKTTPKSQPATPDPNEIVHLQVAEGKTVTYKGIVYADRCTLQVPRRDLDRVDGAFQEVDPAKVPDVAER